jgi:hypothetical protein
MDQQTLNVLIGLGVIVTSAISILTFFSVKTVHLMINSRMDQLLRLTADKATTDEQNRAQLVKDAIAAAKKEQ